MKPLTPREAMQALLDGKKVRWDSAQYSTYVFLTDRGIVDNRGQCSTPHFDSVINKFYIYEEPKPKKKVWQWRFKKYQGWQIDHYLYDEAEAKIAYEQFEQFEKHGEAIEVDSE